MAYLVEFRLWGSAKKTMNEIKDNITRQFGVTPRRLVPHATLVGPLHTRDEKRLLAEVKDACKKYSWMEFSFDGFDSFERKAVFARIRPSRDLEELRADLARRLSEFCTLTEYDHKDEFNFHATLALKDIDEKFEQIVDYVNTYKVSKTNQYVVRITIMKRHRILAEYDLVQGMMLDRAGALDRGTFARTRKELYEMAGPRQLVFHEITDPDVFMISDTHFGHENVIKKFIFRKFDSVKEMNDTMMDNWNRTVKDGVPVYFLGDMSYGRDRHPVDYWLGKLNGDVRFIRGNHDSDIITRATMLHDRYGISYRGRQFLLMHEPYRPYEYKGWIIHGHVHNGDLEVYPFINQREKTVNISVELINYTPLALDRLISLIDSGKDYETVPP